jgi:hypothetical protein
MTSSDTPGSSPDGGRADPRQGPPDVTGGETDANRGRTDDMARHGGGASRANDPERPGGHEPATSGQGSRTGSLLGSQSERTGMGDGTPSGNSQGLAGGQDNGQSPASKNRP